MINLTITRPYNAHVECNHWVDLLVLLPWSLRSSSLRPSVFSWHLNSFTYVLMWFFSCPYYICWMSSWAWYSLLVIRLVSYWVLLLYLGTCKDKICCTEVEYRAIVDTIAEHMWLQRFCVIWALTCQYLFPCFMSIQSCVIHIDNQSVIHITTNPCSMSAQNLLRLTLILFARHIHIICLDFFFYVLKSSHCQSLH